MVAPRRTNKAPNSICLYAVGKRLEYILESSSGAGKNIIGRRPEYLFSFWDSSIIERNKS